MAKDNKCMICEKKYKDRGETPYGGLCVDCALNCLKSDIRKLRDIRIELLKSKYPKFLDGGK